MIEVHRLQATEALDHQVVGAKGRESIVTDHDKKTLSNFADVVTKVLGQEDAHKVVFVGGVALRLLEQTVGIPNGGVFSSRDIDAFYCDTDDAKFQELRAGFKGVKGMPKVDLTRFLREEEAHKPLFNTLVQDSKKNLSSVALRGRLKGNIDSPLEVLEIDYGLSHNTYTLSPSNLFHRYALRAVGGVKERDWKEGKFRRLLEVNRRLNDGTGANMGLRRPKDYPELTRYRLDGRKGLLPKILVTIVNVDGRIGRPYERSCLTSLKI